VKSAMLQIKLTVKHIIIECFKYELDRQDIGIDPILGTAPGPETEDNTKIMTTSLKTKNV